MKNLKLFLVVCAALMIGGCTMFQPQKDTAVFYSIGMHSGCAQEVAEVTNKPIACINLLVEEIPSYADCPFIVTKGHGQNIIFDQNARWASSFEDECYDFVKDYLSRMLSDSVMVVSDIHADGNMVTCHYRLSISFDDFIYLRDEGRIVLRCDWSLYDYIRKSSVITHRSMISVPVDSRDYGIIAAGMRKALELLVNDIVAKSKDMIVGN